MAGSLLTREEQPSEYWWETITAIAMIATIGLTLAVTTFAPNGPHRLSAGLIFAAVFVPQIIRGLISGRILLGRGGFDFHRSERPVGYWLLIAGGTLFCALAVGAHVWR